MVACVCACVCSRMATVCTLLYTRILRGLFDSYPAGVCVCAVLCCVCIVCLCMWVCVVCGMYNLHVVWVMCSLSVCVGREHMIGLLLYC